MLALALAVVVLQSCVLATPTTICRCHPDSEGTGCAANSYKSSEPGDPIDASDPRLLLWLDGDDTATVFEGSPVVWKDKSSREDDAETVVGTPTYVPEEKGWQFDGQSCMEMRSSGPLCVNPQFDSFTIFFVSRYVQVVDFTVGFTYGTDDCAVFSVAYDNDPDGIWIGISDDDFADWTATDEWIHDKHLWTLSCNAATGACVFRLNGELIKNVPINNRCNSLLGLGPTLGCRHDPVFIYARRHYGIIHEVVVYDGDLDDETEQEISLYLGMKHAVDEYTSTHWCFPCTTGGCPAGFYRPPCVGDNDSPPCAGCTPVENAATTATYTCTSASNSRVSACKPGHWKNLFSSADSCPACAMNCVTCSGLPCITCATNYGRTATGSCVLCSSLSTPSRWVAGDVPCEPCSDFVEGCSACTNSACTQCDAGLALETYQSCTSCASGTFYIGPTSPCRSCTLGDPGVCSSADVVLTCSASGVGETCAVCPKGQYFDSTCRSCNAVPLCAPAEVTCTNAADHQCNVCQAATFKDGPGCTECNPNELCSSGLQCIGPGIGEICSGGCEPGAYSDDGVCTECMANPLCLSDLTCEGPLREGETCGECTEGSTPVDGVCTDLPLCSSHSCPDSFALDDPALVCAASTCTDTECCREVACSGPPSTAVPGSENRHFLCPSRAAGSICPLECRTGYTASDNLTCVAGVWTTGAACVPDATTSPPPPPPATSTTAATAATTTAVATASTTGSSATIVEDGEDGPATSSGGVMIIVGVIGACVLCALLVLLAVVLRPKSNKKTPYASGDSDATVVVVDGDAFGTYLKAQIGKLRPVAQGGFGAVYKVTLQDGKIAALKVLDPNSSENAKAEFHRECTVLTSLTLLESPLVVPMLCFCEDPVCLGMEYAPNGTLMDTVANSPATGDDLVMLGSHAAACVAFLHENDVAHMDVKPQNFLRMADDRIVICDFGLACPISQPLDVSVTGGTPQYMAPEMFGGGLIGAGECDVFAWAIMMTVFATGNVPYSQFQTSNLPTLIATNNVRPKFPEGTAGWLVSLVAECWHEDPAKRPSMAQALKRLDARDEACTVLIPSATLNSSFLQS